MRDFVDGSAFNFEQGQRARKLFAAVVLAAGQTLTYEDLLAHCRTALAGFKCPKDLVLLPALPRNPSGKVLKRSLRARDLAGEFTQQNMVNTIV